MVFCLGEPLRRFLLLLLYLHFIFISFLHLHFIFDLHMSMFFILLIFFIHILLFDIIPHPSVYTFSSGHRRVIRDAFSFNHSDIFLSQALRFWVGIFYPQAFFTLWSFTNILTCIYQGFPGSRKFFLEVCRTSYWSLRYRPGQSVCLTHSNPQSSYSERLIFKFCHILAWITCGEKFSL